MEIYAHRGASGYAPENTLSAYAMAFDKFAADGIEIDVHYTSDGQMVVIHDFELSRTTNGSGMVFTKTYAEIRELSAGIRHSEAYMNEKVPSLDEVLELVAAKGGKINIELKAGSFLYPQIEERVIKKVYEYGLEKKTLLSSFDHVAMVRSKEIDPSVPTGILSDSRMYKPAEYVKKTGADAYNVLYAALTPEDRLVLAQEGLMVNCYTPNTPQEIMPMIKMNIDILITNFPDIARKLLEDSLKK